jgi:superfamily I DNA/RNA helicase
MNTPSRYQRAIYTAFQNGDVNINISAVAGSGKTTTLLELLKYTDEKSSLFLAFNKSIVDELKNRNTNKHSQIMTMHSCGWRAIMMRYGSRVKMNPNKCIAKTELAMKKLNIAKEKRGYMFYIVPKMLDLMRCNLCGDTNDEIDKLAMNYAIDVDEECIKVIRQSWKLLVSDRSQFDFADMIYVPATDLSVRLVKYDYVFCDESQDFSLVQHEFIKKCIARHGRLITVGDPRQAIYGFAGADANSYSKLSSVNGSSVRMPLSVCYRCDKNIVNEAKKIVSEIEPYDDAANGVVRDGSLLELRHGDWILCRNVRPLVAAYVWLVRNKIKCKIKGKEIGEGLIALIDKVGGTTLADLERGLREERQSIYDRLLARGVKKPTYHPKMELIEERQDILRFLIDEVSSVRELRDMIGSIFDDDCDGILLSTIHKAKGLENDRVFFIIPELIPSKYAVMDWQLEQEQNLKYVAITRARHELIYVNGSTYMNDLTARLFIQ